MHDVITFFSASICFSRVYYLETAHFNRKVSQIKLKYYDNLLASWAKIKGVCWEQTTLIQGRQRTYLVIRSLAVGCVRLSNAKTIQRLPWRTLLNSPWYVNNKTIHEDTQIPTFDEETKEIICSYFGKLCLYGNDTVSSLHDLPEVARRLKKQ